MRLFYCQAAGDQNPLKLVGGSRSRYTGAAKSDQEEQVTMKFILASQSPRRRELLALLGLEFESLVPDIDEERSPLETPRVYVTRLSRDKAQAAAHLHAGPALILAADTIVVDGDSVLEKPRDAQDAEAILQRLRGRTHTVYTAITLFNTTTGHMQHLRFLIEAR